MVLVFEGEETYIPRDEYEIKYFCKNGFKWDLTNNEVFSLILTHDISGIGDEKISKFNNTLVLSGHTHGLEVNLPIARKMAIDKLKYKSRYTLGLYKVNKSPVYVNVSPGIGTHFFRINNVPEISIITLSNNSDIFK